MATPRQSAEAALETTQLLADFTCDQTERDQLLAWARKNGRPPLALCPCGRAVVIEHVPGLIEAVPVEDRGAWTLDGIRCGACVARAVAGQGVACAA
jgi:hypothetical protein